MFRRQIADPGTVFLNHTRGNEIQPDRVAKFLAAAERSGYRKTSEVAANASTTMAGRLLRYLNYSIRNGHERDHVCDSGRRTQ